MSNNSSMNILSGMSLYDNYIIPLNQVYGDGTRPTIQEYTRADFLKIVPEFKNIFTTDANGIYDVMYSIYEDLGRGIFSEQYYGKQAILCLTLWIAHNLAVSIPRTKNIGNEVNLDSENISQTAMRNQGGKNKKELMAGFREKYSLTTYGRILFPIMEQVGKWTIRGVR